MQRMDEVSRLLQARCSFDFAPIPTEAPDPALGRVFPEQITRLNPPQDFLQFYRRHNGGYQSFFAHGWPACETSVRLHLYGLEEMDEKHQALLTDVEAMLEQDLDARRIDQLDFARRRFALAQASHEMLPIGELGETAYSRRYSMSYLLYCSRCFFVLDREELKNLSDLPQETSYDALRRHAGTLFDPSLAGILNKLLDVLLKGCATVFDLRRAQKSAAAAQTQTK